MGSGAADAFRRRAAGGVVGPGDKLSKAAGNKTLGGGGYGLMPENVDHYAFTTATETRIVLYGVGPVEFKYVNPSDDPRNARPATR